MPETDPIDLPDLPGEWEWGHTDVRETDLMFSLNRDKGQSYLGKIEDEGIDAFRLELLSEEKSHPLAEEEFDSLTAAINRINPLIKNRSG